MRAELKYGLLLNALAITINRFAFLPDFISGFLSGAFVGLGLFLMVVSLIPKNTYDNLLYRKWITSRNG